MLIEKMNLPLAGPMKTSAWRLVRRSVGLKNSIDRSDIERGLIDVEIDHVHGGFFAQLNWCLYIFAYAKAHSAVPCVSLVSQNYRNGNRDWFGDYFQYNFPVQAPGDFTRIIRKKRIRHFSELGFTIDPDLTMREAHDVFFETVSIREPICDEVDLFVRQKYSGDRMLGIHYRGTDKFAEAPSISYEQIGFQAESLLESGRFSGIFVASDDQKFIDFMLKKVTGAPLIARDDSSRSLDGSPLHLRQPGPGNKLGLDAIVNCMLLSRCHSVLRTSSFLSAWASIFNPELRVYLLNRPYDEKLWFPERKILKTALLLPNAD